MSTAAITLALDSEPVEVPMSGPVELRANVAFWVGDALHAADFTHRVHLGAGGATARPCKGRTGVLFARRRQARGADVQG